MSQSSERRIVFLSCSLLGSEPRRYSYWLCHWSLKRFKRKDWLKFLTYLAMTKKASRRSLLHEQTLTFIWNWRVLTMSPLPISSRRIFMQISLAEHESFKAGLSPRRSTSVRKDVHVTGLKTKKYLPGPASTSDQGSSPHGILLDTRLQT